MAGSGGAPHTHTAIIQYYTEYIQLFTEFAVFFSTAVL